MRYFLLVIIPLILSLVLSPLNLPAQESRGKERPAKAQTRKQSDKKKRDVVVAPDLTDPAMIDYRTATIYMTPEDSLEANAYLRSNFTDQFLSHYDFPGRIFPASRIFGFKQAGKYYRACRFDERNAVFGELLVKGEMSLYFCRKLPQEAGLIEFISSDPSNRGYRNFMIQKYRDRARFANDYYYFVVMQDDSLNPVPIKDAAEFSEKFLKEKPHASFLMNRFIHAKTSARAILAPAAVVVACVAVVLSGSIEEGLLISSPFIAGGLIYYLANRKKTGKIPSPEIMAEIVRLYNS